MKPPSRSPIAARPTRPMADEAGAFVVVGVALTGIQRCFQAHRDASSGAGDAARPRPGEGRYVQVRAVVARVTACAALAALGFALAGCGAGGGTGALSTALSGTRSVPALTAGTGSATATTAAEATTAAPPAILTPS